MVKNKPNQSIQSFAQKALYHPIIQGSFLGGITMWSVTPLNNWTNHTLNGSRMTLRTCMIGASEYAAAAIPGYAVAFSIHRALGGNNEQDSPITRFKITFTAGMASGFVSTPFELLAQNKQLSKYKTTLPALNAIVSNNGYLSLFRGASSVMLRQGVWVSVYLGGAPILSKYFKENGMSRWAADASGVILSAGGFGCFSAPFQQLRYRKQLGLTEPARENKSYLTHIKEIAYQKENASIPQRCGFFFKAIVPRTVAVTAAAGMLFEGNELFNKYINPRS